MPPTSLFDKDAKASEILAVIHDQAQPWTVRAEAILALEATDFPESYEGSGSWIDSVIEPIGLRRASAWRYRALARDWTWLRAELEKADIKAPQLRDLDPTTSPEQLEILIRLIKATPPNIWSTQANAVLGHATTLRELRRTWSHYRRVLKGRTARGRASKGFAGTVHVDPSDPQTIEDQYVASACRSLESLFPTILEALTGNRIARTSFFLPNQHEEMPGLLNENPAQLTDWPIKAVAVIEEQENSSVLVHGFLVGMNKKPIAPGVVKSPLVDVLWRVGPEAVQVPAAIGALVFEVDSHEWSGASAPADGLKQCVKDDRLLRWLLARGLSPCYRTEANKAKKLFRAMPLYQRLK